MSENENKTKPPFTGKLRALTEKLERNSASDWSFCISSLHGEDFFLNFEFPNKWNSKQQNVWLSIFFCEFPFLLLDFPFLVYAISIKSNSTWNDQTKLKFAFYASKIRMTECSYRFSHSKCIHSLENGYKSEEDSTTCQKHTWARSEVLVRSRSTRSRVSNNIFAEALKKARLWVKLKWIRQEWI